MLNNPTLRNPYDPTHPVSDPALFFGREDVFAFIRQRTITGRRAQALAIIGQRGTGKTSVLMQVPHRIEARFITAYIDLADVDFQDVGGLFAAMADAARAAMDAAGLSTYRLPPIPEDPNVNLLEWFSETYLDVTLSALRNNRRLIFLFDETSKLLDAIDKRDVPQTFGDTISSLIARDDRLDIIFAVDAEDEGRLETFAPLSDPLLHKRIGHLDDAAAEALTRRPVAAYYQVQDDALEGILAMTGGHPYLLHVLNGLLWERAISRQYPGAMTINDVSAVLRQAVTEADPVLRHHWTRSTTNERQALSAMTALTAASRGMPVRVDDVRTFLLRESELPLDETALAAALRRLEYREILRAPTKGSYTFTTGLQHQWMLLVGDVQPTMLRQPAGRINARRLAIPVVLLLIAAIGVALGLGRILTTPPNDGSTVPTVTLDQDLLQTRRAAAATQTRAAQLTQQPPTNVPVVAPPAVSPTSTVPPTRLNLTIEPPPTLTPTATTTSTPTLTLVPSATGTIIDTPFPTATFTPQLSITPPPFPTGQVQIRGTPPN